MYSVNEFVWIFVVVISLACLFHTRHCYCCWLLYQREWYLYFKCKCTCKIFSIIRWITISKLGRAVNAVNAANSTQILKCDDWFCIYVRFASVCVNLTRTHQYREHFIQLEPKYINESKRDGALEAIIILCCYLIVWSAQCTKLFTINENLICAKSNRRNVLMRN